MPQLRRSRAPSRPRRAPRSANRTQALRLVRQPTSAPRRIDAPVATTSVLRGNSGNTNRSMPLVRREFIGDINGSVAFATTQFSLNPAIESTFPWGSQISSSFEEYDAVSVSFCYEPESSSTSTGAIILSFDYDALDTPPVSKQEALEMADSIRAAPWVPCRLNLKPADLRKRGTLFTRTGTVPNSDLKTYDLGNLHVSTVGQAGATVIGELWIEYHFTLRTPQTSSLASPALQEGRVAGNSVSPAAPFGATSTVTGTAVTAAPTTLTFVQAGTYAVILSLTGLTTGSGVNTATTGSTATVSLMNSITGPNVSSTGQMQWACLVTATVGQTLVLAFSGSGFATLTGSTTRVCPFTLG